MGASRLQTLDILGHCLLFYFHLQPGGGQLGQMLRSLLTNQVRALSISTNRRTGSPAVLISGAVSFGFVIDSLMTKQRSLNQVRRVLTFTFYTLCRALSRRSTSEVWFKNSQLMRENINIYSYHTKKGHGDHNSDNILEQFRNEPMRCSFMQSYQSMRESFYCLLSQEVS